MLIRDQIGFYSMVVVIGMLSVYCWSKTSQDYMVSWGWKHETLKLFFCDKGSKYILQQNGQRKQHTVLSFCFTSFHFLKREVINPSFISLNAVLCIINWEQYGCKYTACLFFVVVVVVGSGIWACGLFCSDKKEMKIQSSFTKTLSSGWSDKINAQPHQSP